MACDYEYALERIEREEAKLADWFESNGCPIKDVGMALAGPKWTVHSTNLIDIRQSIRSMVEWIYMPKTLTKFPNIYL